MKQEAACPVLPFGEEKYSFVGVSGLLVVTVLLVFSPLVFFPFVTLDDPFYIYDNQNVRSGLSLANLYWAFSTLHGNISYWHPLTWISHQIDCQLFGLQAGAHHLTNVLLHAANSVLVFALARKLCCGLRSALFVAAVFAVHPLHVESVAWVSERKDVLCGLFYLGALNFYLDFRSNGRIAIFIASVICALLASMSKPAAVTLPAVIILLEIFVVRPRTEVKSNSGFGRSLRIWHWLPFVAISVVLGIITVLAQQRIGAIQSLAALPVSDRLDHAWLAYLTYVRRFFWPMDLCVAYGIDLGASRFGILALFLLVAATVLAWCSKRKFALGAFGWFAFLAMLLPTVGLIQVGPQFTADRYMYLPIVAFSLLLVGIFRQLPAWMRARRLEFFGGVSVCIALSLATITQVMYWKDSVTLFGRAVELQPEFWFARLGLGTALTSVGRHAEALEQFQHALQLPGNAAETHRMIGVCLLSQRRAAEALEQFRLAQELKPSANTALMLAHLYLGQVDASIRDGPAAGRFADEASRELTNPEGSALLIMASAHASAGDFDKAIRFLDSAVKDGKKQGNILLLREAEKRRQAYRTQQERNEG